MCSVSRKRFGDDEMNQVCFEELFDIGSSKRVFQSEWRDKGVPFYRAREIAKLAKDGYVDNELFIDEELYKKYTKKYGKPEAGDIMVTGVGTLGVCYIVRNDDKFYFKDGNILWFHLKNKERVLPEYIVKAFDSKAIRDEINRNSSGTTVGTFTIQTAKKMVINLPKLDEQREIIEKISKLEKIIRDRKQQLLFLDNLIKSRFVEMFGDPIKNPKGWEIVTIGDIVTDVRYGTSKPAVEGGKYPYVRMNNLTVDGQLDLRDLKYIDIPDDEIEKSIVRKGDVLFNRTNSIELVGKTAIFDLPEDMVIAGYIIRVRLNERILPEVLVQYMNLEALKKILRSMAKGAVNQANINAQELQSIKIYIPDMKLQNQFVQMKHHVDKLKVEVQKSLDETQTLFDSLMQEYFG